MKARDVVGRTIIAVHQQRVTTRMSNDHATELEADWEVVAFTLDNGRTLILSARETDDSPIVTACVRGKAKRGR